MSSPWWVKSVGVQPKNKRLEASEIRQRLDAVLNYYYEANGRQTRVSVDGMDGWRKCRCPFHKDGRASASVNWAKMRFRCHACDFGGDAIDIVMREENLAFRDAMEWIERL